MRFNNIRIISRIHGPGVVRSAKGGTSVFRQGQPDGIRQFLVPIVGDTAIWEAEPCFPGVNWDEGFIVPSSPCVRPTFAVARRMRATQQAAGRLSADLPERGSRPLQAHGKDVPRFQDDDNPLSVVGKVARVRRRTVFSNSVMGHPGFLRLAADDEVRRPLGLRRCMDDQFIVVLHPLEPFGDIRGRIVNRPLGNFGLAAQKRGPDLGNQFLLAIGVGTKARLLVQC